MDDNRYLINSVLRAALILESFSFEKFTYTNTELSKLLGLNKSSLTRLLYSLEKCGFLQRDPKTAEYKLTHRLFRIGSIYINQVSLQKEAMTFLSELASSCKETVHLAILDGSEVLYLDKIESSQSIGMMSRIGNRSPAYCTAVGKVMLAHLNDKDLEAFFRSVELKRHTSNTITDPAELGLHLNKIREHGYAMDNGEHEAEVKCVAAPIWDRTAKVVAGISVSGPAFRINSERIEGELIFAVKRTAEKISRRLGYLA
jgi:DNA-binding IclR family transcriptional regulator